MMKIISAEEARAMQNNANGNKEKLLEIQEQIKKEAGKKYSRGFIVVDDDTSNDNLQILKNLGYRIQLKFDSEKHRMYYVIFW